MPKKDKKKLAPVYTFRSNAQIEKQKKARAYYEQLELFLDDPDFLDDVALQRSGRIFKNKTQVYKGSSQKCLKNTRSFKIGFLRTVRDLLKSAQRFGVISALTSTL